METQEKTRKFTRERISWELARGFHSFRKSPAPIVILMQLAAFVFVSSKGAGRIYADMILILLGITVISWFFTTFQQGNHKVLLYTLILLTIGTMLQCTFKQESILAHPELAGAHPALSLQLQYGIAFVAAVLASFVYRKTDKISSLKFCKYLIILSIMLSMATLVLAKSVGNVRNWITIGGFSIQTTEIVKLLYLFVASSLLGIEEGPSGRRQVVFYLFTLINVMFLALQSEFGTMLLLIIIFLVYIFLFIPDIKVFIKTVIVMAVAVAVAVFLGSFLASMRAKGSVIGTNPLASIYLHNYDKIANRFIFWMDPNKDPQGLGYQLIQAKNSILLGGWFGTSSITDLPVKTSDLVYPALIQRCGIVFGVLVFILFILNWLEGILLFVRKKDRYHCAIAVGIVFMILTQALIIIGGSTGICPLTGITLPFISSGGSSLMVSAIMVGLLITVSGNVPWEGNNKDEDEFFKESAVLAKWRFSLRHTHADRPDQNFSDCAGDQSGSRPE